MVEDEHTLADIVGDTLDSNGFKVQIAYDGEQALTLLNRFTFDIIVTDIMMPRMDGLSLVEHLRKKGNKIPVLFLSARSSSDDVVEGFEAGGNDYIRKPFSMKELIVRIKALLERVHSNPQNEPLTYHIGKYLFDTANGTLLFEENPQKTQVLSGHEADILSHLCRNLNHVVENKTILLDLWGDDNFFSVRSLNVFISKLRHKLAQDPTLRILMIRSIGYKLISNNN